VGGADCMTFTVFELNLTFVIGIGQFNFHLLMMSIMMNNDFLTDTLFRVVTTLTLRYQVILRRTNLSTSEARQQEESGKYDREMHF
jgi:hypothetical protein